ncbi:MAG: hypothetical protein SGJ21_00740 [Alphaproteobacteria bacterium]|nr:hypothetical protein [Alphaproteobacteria bacterium]
MALAPETCQKLVETARRSMNEVCWPLTSHVSAESGMPAVVRRALAQFAGVGEI